jgi:DNA-binding SARP family transcriptional activator/Flp pilus assembly protein TadD/TolB-like protein
MLTRNPDESCLQLSQTAAFELRLLGQFELVLRQSGTLIPVPTAKMKALLAYLAAAPRFTETRRRLAGLLWASSGEDQARQSLRQLLSNFRRGASLGASGIVLFDESSVSLHPSLVAIDRTDLMEERPDADMAELSRMADLYRNDFGLGLEIGEADFDAWLHGERVRCRDAAIALFDRLVRALAGLGRHEEALGRANRLAEIDPTREETHRLVIAEEAIVSGRASAMLRYETFRVLLSDELGIRPEAATLRLLDQLRRQPTVEKPSVEPAAGLMPAGLFAPAAPPATRRWKLAAMGTGLVLVLLGGMVATSTWHLIEAPYIDDDTGRVSIVVLPFETAPGHDALRGRAGAYEAEAGTTFARSGRLRMIALPDRPIARDPIKIGRDLRARYVVKTMLSEPSDGIRADVNVIDSASGATVSVLPLTAYGTTAKFAREMVRSVFAEIAIHRAKILSATDPESTPALLWRASALQISSRVGASKPEEFALYEKVLARDPKQLTALLGLAGALVLKVARDQSPDRMTDIRLAQSYLQTAYEQAPFSGEVALEQGMLKKLQQQYAEAIPDFERSVRLDPTQWIAAAQVAHCKMFLGRLQEAYDQMEGVMPNLLPDIGAAESAFIAGETALVSGHPDRAVEYLDIAVSGNPTMPRIHALRAAALWMAGRPAEAVTAAGLSQTLNPPHKPETMARRGGPEAGQSYQEARDRYLAAFRSALALIPPH